jgi:replicative DNA helicase
MRDVANALGIAVIGLAKLTREVDKQPNKRPHLKDIRECGDIEYHADEIFFIHREQYYLRENTPPEWRNIAEIIHGKGRMGLDLEAPPARLWFSGGMFFLDLFVGWASWEVDHGGKS